jgi:hypothetical protein
VPCLCFGISMRQVARIQSVSTLQTRVQMHADNKLNHAVLSTSLLSRAIQFFNSLSFVFLSISAYFPYFVKRNRGFEITLPSVSAPQTLPGNGNKYTRKMFCLYNSQVFTLHSKLSSLCRRHLSVCYTPQRG